MFPMLYFLLLTLSPTLCMPPSLPELGGNCCLEKTVGGVNYTFAYQNEAAVRMGCINTCVYSVEGSMGKNHVCFAAGELPVNCLTKGCKECGMKKKGKRIVGGTETEPNEYPWMAVVLIKNEMMQPLTGCPGSVINSRWILTTANCLVQPLRGPPPLRQMSILLGEHDQMDPFDEFKMGVSRLVFHPVPSLDTAMVRTIDEIQIGIYTPVCLPQPGEIFAGKQTVVAGWGYGKSATPNDTRPWNFNTKLQEVELTFMQKSDCDQVMKNLVEKQSGQPVPSNITWAKLCVRNEENKGTCFDDDGAPMMVKKGNSWVLAAIVSGLDQFKCAAEGTTTIANEVAEPGINRFVADTASDGKYCTA